MSEEIAKQNMQTMARLVKGFFDALSKYLNELLEATIKNKEYEPYRALAKAINSGDSAVFKPNDDYCGKLHNKLNNEGINHISANGYFIVKNEDLPKVSELYRELLVSELDYYREVSRDEFENAIASSEKIKDKDKHIYTFEGLNLYEFESLKAKCNDIKKGFTIGTDKKGVLYSLSIHESEMYRKNPKKNDVCKAFLASALSINGPNKKLKREQIEADLALEETVRNLTDVDSSFYLVSETDNSRYIEVTSKGFEVYDTVVEDGKCTQRVVEDISRKDINYNSELQRYMDTMYDKTIVHSAEELGKHLSASEARAKSNRPKKNREAYLYSKAHKEITDIINEMIKTNSSQPLSISAYEAEAAEILTALQKEEQLEKYDSSYMDKLKNVFTEKELKIPDYKDVVLTLTTQMPTVVKTVAEKNKEVKTKEERINYENSNRQRED